MTRLLLIALLWSAGGAAAAEVPDFAAVTADGNSITLADEAAAQTTVLFFWASWCPYCKALMPHLESIRLEYGDDVKILAIHFRDDADGTAYLRERGFDFTAIPDGDRIAKRYGVHGTPGVIIVDSARESRFDLRELPRRALPASDETLSHGQKAQFRAPYWAAAVRKVIREISAEQ